MIVSAQLHKYEKMSRGNQLVFSYTRQDCVWAKEKHFLQQGISNNNSTE